MRYLSVCSGVEAATTAWHDLGWTPVGFSEIEKFPSEVLAHHYPSVPNLGDMTKYKEWNLESVGLLVGGTPCQSFSVAGLRKGLEDPRGNLALTYVGILDKFRPKWCIWENVPGVLSSNRGRDFGSFLGALAELGYGFAYRVLDAQYFGVPQRRRRVFVVGCLGDWESPAKVLLERESLLRNPAPSRKAGEEVTGVTATSVGDDSKQLSGLAYAPDISPCLETTCNDYSRADGFTMMVYETHPADSRVKPMGDTCQTVTSRWGTGGGNVPLVQSIGFTQCDAARDVGNNVSPTLRSGGNGGYPGHSVAYSIREDAKANNFSATPLEVTPALQALRPSVQSHHAQTFIAQSFNVNARPDEMKLEVEVSGTLTASQNSGLFKNMAVRRLTPVECERLQGFPDGYTNIPWRGKPDSPDAPRYKAMGNSMAVPVMKWIGNRIQELEDGLL